MKEKSYVAQWRDLRKAIGRLMQVTDNYDIGERADYREQDVINCDWHNVKAINDIAYLCEEDALDYSENWMDFINKLYIKDGYGAPQDWEDADNWWQNTYSSQEEKLEAFLKSRVIKPEFKKLVLNLLANY